MVFVFGNFPKPYPICTYKHNAFLSLINLHVMRKISPINRFSAPPSLCSAMHPHPNDLTHASPLSSHYATAITLRQRGQTCTAVLQSGMQKGMMQQG